MARRADDKLTRRPAAPRLSDRRRLRWQMPANDNRAPLTYRLGRLASYGLLAAAVGGGAWLLGSWLTG